MLASSYETLECSPEMSDEELERKFRELCQENHPDRLAGEEIPAGIIKLAEERFQEIQSAYEVVVKSRSKSPSAAYPRHLGEPGRRRLDDGKISDEKIPDGRPAGLGGGHCSDDAASDSMREQGPKKKSWNDAPGRGVTRAAACHSPSALIQPWLGW